jgi:hypothetical protein
VRMTIQMTYRIGYSFLEAAKLSSS